MQQDNRLMVLSDNGKISFLTAGEQDYADAVNSAWFSGAIMVN